MRYIFLPLIALAAVCPALFASNGPEIIAPQVDSPPVLDGKISNVEWPEGVEVTPKTGFWDPSVAGGNKTELSYVFHVMYDDAYIYVAAGLTDDDIQTDTAPARSQGERTWEDDSMEIYFDANHDHANGEQFVVTPINAVRFPDGKSFGKDPNTDYYVVAAAHGDNNWQLEARFLIKQYGNLKEGDEVGFNMGSNDDDGGGTEDGALFWSGKGAVDCICGAENLWGDLIFGEKTTLAVRPNHKLATTWGRLKVGK